jgi:hypothetical protein
MLCHHTVEGKSPSIRKRGVQCSRRQQASCHVPHARFEVSEERARQGDRIEERVIQIEHGSAQHVVSPTRRG